ncbi:MULTISPECIES: archease [Kitasatospora]|uniref:archease n=1 Tax=Kitasatospora TaxID=2063 RepID=UPI000C713058|nr:archease [Kitasatospora sp. GP30]MDH6143689.1 SHS2 domain-containing protein [Kitasatospora sp. GP30]
MRGQPASRTRREGALPVTGQQRSASGHRTLAHTADLRVEAWSPTVAGCITQAVRAVVDGFADTSAARPVGERACEVTAAADEDLLVAVLEEVVYRMDADGEIPLDTEVLAIRDTAAGRVLSVRFRMADADTAEPVGAVPKAVSLHGLRLRGGPDGWTCRVTVDV